MQYSWEICINQSQKLGDDRCHRSHQPTGLNDQLFCSGEAATRDWNLRAGMWLLDDRIMPAGDVLCHYVRPLPSLIWGEMTSIGTFDWYATAVYAPSWL